MKTMSMTSFSVLYQTETDEADIIDQTVYIYDLFF